MFSKGDVCTYYVLEIVNTYQSSSESMLWALETASCLGLNQGNLHGLVYIINNARNRTSGDDSLNTPVFK